MMHRAALARAVFVLSIVFVLAMASVASAAPVEGPSGSAFYTPPSPTPTGSAGELVWYRPATINLNVTLPGIKAWTVLYQSTGQQGQPDWVTGTVIAPTAKWSGKGERPVVTYAEGTQGIAHQCAPSIQMAEGTEYDGGAIIESLKKGYAVTVTDYQGYTNGAVPTYAAGKAEGQAVLDVVRAGRQVPGSGIGTKAPVIVWGYSQGGQAASWAAELQSSYAPDVDMVGLAAGGTPSNLQAVGEFDNASVGTAFGLDGLIGLSAAYPEEFDLAEFSNAAGLEAAGKLLSECAIQSLAEFRDVNSDEYTIGNKSFAQLEAEHPAIEKVFKEQELGTKPVPVPVYHYHGLEDEFVPVAQDVALHQAWCKLGVTDDFQLYPGDHLLTDPTAIGNVIKWIEERLAGKKAPSTCGDHAEGATLPSSARLTPETGDLIIPLPAWELSGKVTEKSSGISVEVPKGSTLSARRRRHDRRAEREPVDTADRSDHLDRPDPGHGQGCAHPDRNDPRHRRSDQRRRVQRERERLGERARGLGRCRDLHGPDRLHDGRTDPAAAEHLRAGERARRRRLLVQDDGHRAGIRRLRNIRSDPLGHDVRTGQHDRNDGETAGADQLVGARPVSAGAGPG